MMKYNLCSYNVSFSRANFVQKVKKDQIKYVVIIDWLQSHITRESLQVSANQRSVAQKTFTDLIHFLIKRLSCMKQNNPGFGDQSGSMHGSDDAASPKSVHKNTFYLLTFFVSSLSRSQRLRRRRTNGHSTTKRTTNKVETKIKQQPTRKNVNIHSWGETTDRSKDKCCVSFTGGSGVRRCIKKGVTTKCLLVSLDISMHFIEKK